MAQAARVVIGLEFELVAQILPEGDRTAPIVRLDEYFLDALSLHVYFRRWLLRYARSASETIADSDRSVSTA
jgi:hypothetical protein